MAWYKVADSNKFVADGTIKKVSAGGKKLCIIYSQDAWFALGSKCPHAGADLSQGWCEQGKLVCPFHRHQYSLDTGKGAVGQNDFVHTFPVKTEGDGIYVEVKSIFENLKDLFSR